MSVVSARSDRPFPGPVAAFFISLGAWVATGLFIVMLSDPEQTEIGIATLGVGQALGLGLVALLAGRSVPAPQSERLGVQGFPPRFLLALLLLLPMALVVSELNNVAHVLFPAPDAEDVVARATERLATDSPLSTVETALVVVGIAPLVEEWLYRGVLQQGLVAHLGRLGGVGLTACLFGLAHIEPSLSAGSSIATFAATLPMGLALGLVRLATGSLWAAIVLHAAYNAAALAALALREELPIPGFNAPGSHTPPEFLVPALLCVGVALVPLLRAARRSDAFLPIPDRLEGEDPGPRSPF